MTKKTKVQMVKEHLEKHKSITLMESMNNYQCTRLSDVILKLRRSGMDIETKFADEYGNPTGLAIYKLVED